MLIEIHAIQNHSPANLNRDDLGAPKTCYFGGVLRSRISSQCINGASARAMSSRISAAEFARVDCRNISLSRSRTGMCSSLLRGATEMWIAP